MNTIAKTRENNHRWTRDENILITRAYLDGKSVSEAQLLVPDIKINSVRMKYANCLYLDKGSVRTALKNVSKEHEAVWNEIKEEKKEQDVSDYWDEKLEEDGETYFMCAGICGRVMHYEDTNEFQMCGRCEHDMQKKGRRK
jgi:L-rhamnose mutarotase